MLLYPVPSVIVGGMTEFFEMPDDVWQWLEMWDKVPKERFKVGRPGMYGQALRGSCDADGSHAAFTQWSPTGSENGRVEIQADRTMVLAVSDQSGVAPAATSMNQEQGALRESGAEEDMCW
ncbi:hypothetical protein NDU88_004816 [Pleurodeles waltl]|uniref:Uncharacterized protein n=1 Tax=Pleurodeles waltl TaxID=8319 RepID=A0AAV7L2H1_PLEWA|nr:hypothetical protein NDU88_004816 [Pleurodeles waltl]